jgi:hypothetical protein
MVGMVNEGSTGHMSIRPSSAFKVSFTGRV